MKLNRRGLLIVLSGPSGVGKGTVRKELFKMPGHNLTYSISMTTRKPRAGEVDGQDYYFVSKKEFEEQIKRGNLLEYATFVGNFYGTPKDKVEEQLEAGKEVFLEIDVEGAMQVREKCPDAVFIFLVPPSKEKLYQRLRDRGTETEYDIKNRIEKANREFMLAHQYDYIVVNDDVKNAADKILAIIRSEHARTFRTIHEYLRLMEENEEWEE